MQRCIPPLLLLIASAFLNAAEPASFDWAFSGGGISNDKTRCVAVDLKGNVLLCGECTGPFPFGDTTVAGAGQLDFFIAKLDPQGHPLWIQTGGGSGIDRGYAVATDAQGNIYAGGHFQSSDAYFGSTKVAPTGPLQTTNYDAFLAKYSPDGKLLWVRSGGSEGYDYIHGVAVDPKGNVLVTGAIAGAATFGDFQIERPIGSHLFCAKYDPSGKLLWMKASMGTASNSANGIAVDAAGNAYVGGSNRGAGGLGGFELKTLTGQDSLLAKFNPDGDVLWVATHHGDAGCLIHEVTCDSSGRVWVSGMFKGKANFGEATAESSNDKDNDAFIAHFAPDGELRWTRFGRGPGVDYGLGVATDGRGNSFLTGEFSSTFDLAGTSLASEGSTDVYVAGFDALGVLQWALRAGGASGDNAFHWPSIAVANSRWAVLSRRAPRLVIASLRVAAAQTSTRLNSPCRRPPHQSPNKSVSLAYPATASYENAP